MTVAPVPDVPPSKKDSPPPVHVALANVARRVLPVGKQGVAPAEMGRYPFRRYDDVVDGIHQAMADEGVIPFYEMLSEPRHEEWSGKMHRLVVELRLDLIGPAGDRLSTHVWAEALDNGDKGIGKAVSYALKDVLARILTLPFGPGADTEATDVEPRDVTPRPKGPPADLIHDNVRAAIVERIDQLDDDARARLFTRWSKLTAARALHPLDNLRVSELPSVEALLDNAGNPDVEQDTPTVRDDPDVF